MTAYKSFIGCCIIGLLLGTASTVFANKILKTKIYIKAVQQKHYIVVNTKNDELVRVDTSEARCLSKMVYTEARGESVKGQLAVIDVAIRRASQSDLDICTVLRKEGQYAATDVHSKDVPEEILDLSIQSLAGTVNYAVSKNATHFHSVKIRPPSWTRNMIRVARIGGHIFYRFKHSLV